MEEQTYTGKASLPEEKESASAPLSEEQKQNLDDFLASLRFGHDLKIGSDTKLILHKRYDSLLIAIGKPGCFIVFKQHAGNLKSNHEAQERGESCDKSLLHGFKETKANQSEMANFDRMYHHEHSKKVIPLGNLPLDYFGHATVYFRSILREMFYPEPSLPGE